MAKTLDFNKIKKEFITITLRDKEKTKLRVLPPSKELYEGVVIVKERLIQLLTASEEDVDNADVVGDIYDVVAQCMSRNQENIEITKKQLEQMLDFADVWQFLNLYVTELMMYEKN